MYIVASLLGFSVSSVAQAASAADDFPLSPTTIRTIAVAALIVVVIAVLIRIRRNRTTERPGQAAPRYIYRRKGPLYPRKEELDGLSAFNSPERVLEHTWIEKKGAASICTIDIDRFALLQANYNGPTAQSDPNPASQDSSRRHAPADGQKSDADSASAEGNGKSALDIESDAYPQGEKSTWDEQVQMLIERDNGGDSTALKSLIQWGKGCTWPGGRLASEYLLSVGRRAYSLVLDVLKTQDDEWKYRVITGLVYNWPRELQEEIAPVLETLTYNPSDDHWNVEVDVAAAEVLCENKLLDQERRRAMIDRVVRNNPRLDEDSVAALKACVE